MASSSTQIANLALGKLGQERISSLADTSTEAVWANEYYAHARDYVTECALWRHAKKTATLASTTNTRSDDFDYAYSRPSDCLSFRYILSEQGAFDPHDPIRFECEADLIFTDEESARGVYIAQITDVTKFTPSFTEAIAWYLAHLLVQPLRMENRLMQLTADGFQRAMEQAVACGAVEHLIVRSAEETMPDWLAYR